MNFTKNHEDLETASRILIAKTFLKYTKTSIRNIITVLRSKVSNTSTARQATTPPTITSAMSAQMIARGNVEKRPLIMN